MGIHKREDILKSAKAAVWHDVEGETITQWDFAVEPKRGTGEDHKTWLQEHDITQYYAYSRFVCFFKRDSDAAQFYLAWGV